MKGGGNLSRFFCLRPDNSELCYDAVPHTLAHGLKSTADQLFIVRDQVLPVAVTWVLALLFHYDGNSLLGSREVDVEGSELANFGLHFDKTIMLSYDRIADGKTQTTPHRLR